MIILEYKLIKTTRRLTFDITYQAPETIFMGDDDGDYFKFVASNGYEVISRSRMDIQTERLWLLGAKYKDESRSGSMVFSSDEKRDAAYDNFKIAIDEWATHNGGKARESKDTLPIDRIRTPINTDEWHVEWWNESMKLMLPNDYKIDSFYSYNNGTIKMTIKRNSP